MELPLNCIIVDADAQNRREMAEFLTQRGMTVAAALPAIDELANTLASGTSGQLVLVGLDPRPAESLAALRPIIRKFSSVDFFVLSGVVDADLLMDAIHSGVTEFIRQPIDPAKFMAGVERVAATHSNGRRGRLVNIIPTVGGCGATTVACNLAVAFARSARTVLIDLDLVGGTVATSFDLRPRYTIADLMATSELLDRQLLDNALAVHGDSGLAVLARPELPEEAERVTGPGVSRLLGALLPLFDYVVIDSSMDVDGPRSAAARIADINVLVAQLNVPSVRNAGRLLGALQRMDMPVERIRVVVNRYAKRGTEIRPDELEQALGMKVAWMIPNDYRSAIDAINFGRPLVLRSPRSEISGSFSGLKELLNGKASANGAHVTEAIRL